MGHNEELIREAIREFPRGEVFIRLDVHPTVLTHIELHYSLKGGGLDAATVEKVIKMAEESYCPVWALMRNNVADPGSIRSSEGTAPRNDKKVSFPATLARIACAISCLHQAR